jgi:NADH-quinone oxidoreductase subunit L
MLGSFILGVMYLYSIKIKKINDVIFAAIALTTPFVSFVFTWMIFLKLGSGSDDMRYTAFKWLKVAHFDISIAFLADHLSIFMALFVTFIGWLIHIYAAGYMKGDEGYGKFFSYFNLFLGMMLLLVLGNNPIVMFFGWEGVGLCSYLLISFYYKDAKNVIAGNKAFIVNRIGDFGFVIGLSALFVYIGMNGFDYASLEQHIGSIPKPVLSFIAFFLFVGAMGKSAQIPLYVWLPDAMAGPTPVSALIHAATMVTAGVYMVSRFHFLYSLTPGIGEFIAVIGAVSSLFAAVIAMRQRDIKKILAYSTMSQLGYMFVAVGLGFYSSGLFHVFTHAFFKALLFMGAGAVILQLHHEQDIFHMGRMKEASKITYYTFLVATLAICGIFPFAGFFSKDEILFGAFASEHYVIWLIELFTAGLTAYYMFRLFFTVFIAPKSSKRAEPLPLSSLVTYPLVALAAGSLLAGFIGVPKILGGSNMVAHWLSMLSDKDIETSHAVEFSLMGINTIVVLAGVYVAYKKFAFIDLTKDIKLTGIIYHKFYIDEIYDTLFVKNLQKLSNFIGKFFDRKLIDGTVMMFAKSFYNMGELISVLQNGNVRFYAFSMLLGASAFFTYLIYVMG